MCLLKKMRWVRQAIALCLSVTLLIPFSQATSLLPQATADANCETGLAILEAIDVAPQTDLSHTARCLEVESSLNALAFENSDSTITTYLFAEPIKYIDKTGAIKDKTNDLFCPSGIKSEQYAYVNAENDIQTFFPKILNNHSGVLLTYGETEIELYPQTSCLPVARKQTLNRNYSEENYVYYDNAFGADTSIRYSATFSGFKEDIILNKYTSSKFSFIVKTNGLSIKKTPDSTVLVDSKGVKVAEIANLFAYDNASIPNVTEKVELKISEVVEAQEYDMTICVDEAYLRNPNVVYPVIIDPTITINPTGSGTGKTIQDVSVFTNASANSYGAEGYIYAGNTNNLVSGRGVARTLMKFPGLRSNASLSNINTSRIVDVNLFLYENSGKTTSSTLACVYYTGTSWTESTAKAANIGWGSTGSTIHSPSASGSNKWIGVNLTSALSSWRANATSADKGIMLLNGNETNTGNCMRFNSTESSQNKPFITVTWGKYNITHYLDQGYRARFSSAASAVNGHQAVVTKIFKNLFGLTVTSNVVSFTSFADDCRIASSGGVTANNLANTCSHSPTHLTNTALRNDLVSIYGAGTNTYSRVLWTGHILNGNPPSDSNSANHTVIITPKMVTSGSSYTNVSSANVNKESRFTLLHELSHQLGAPDHYCYANGENGGHCSNPNCCSCNGKPIPVCVMQSRKDIETTDIDSLYCSACKTTINTHIGAHH